MTLLKSVRSFLLFVILILTSSIFAQNPFEGKIVMRISGDETADINYFVKGEKIRMEMDAEGDAAVILNNTQTKKIIMMMPGQNMYMEFDAKQFLTENNIKNNDDDMGEIKKTGEHKEINGYECEKWLFKDEDDNTVEAWMTDELGDFFMMMNPMDRGSQEKWKDALQGDYFPMKVDVIEDGKKTSSMEVLSVNEMSLKDELFKVAPGMQKFDMPNMDMLKQN